MGLSVSKALKGASVAVLLCALGTGARADAIPYPGVGFSNTATYTFTASTSGDIIAYYAGSTASYENQLGLMVNGVDTGIYGLDNKNPATVLGTSLNFGHVNAGDTLTFILKNITYGGILAYSDPSLNQLAVNS